MNGAVIEEPVRAESQPSARMVTGAPDADIHRVAALLELGAPTPVMAVCGRPLGSEAEIAASSRRLAVAVDRAVQRTGAVVLDATGYLDDADAPHSGSGPRPPVIRVVSRRSPTPPTSGGRYTHVVLTDIDTEEEEQQVLCALGHALAQGMPTALLVVGDDAAGLAARTAATQRGLQIVVENPSGETLDDALTHRLSWALHPDQVLKDAWLLFTVLDRAAVGLRARFELFQATILLLGTVATLLAILTKELGVGALRWAVVAASIAVAGLTALSGRRAAGKRWIVTRAAAESVKSEIFRYRTRTGRYAEGSLHRSDTARRAEILAGRLGTIERRLMHTEVGNSALPMQERDIPVSEQPTQGDGLGPLSADDYVAARINDQLRYYRARLRVYDLRRRVLQGIAVGASSAGALVAATGGQIWVALTSAVAAAPLAYLAHLQVEKTIVTYNQSVAQLDDVLRHWHARAPHARSRQAFARLVEATEAILTAEHGAWVEEMTEAMHHLDDAQPSAGQPHDAET